MDEVTGVTNLGQKTGAVSHLSKGMLAKPSSRFCATQDINISPRFSMANGWPPSISILPFHWNPFSAESSVGQIGGYPVCDV
jgi:hypothetical protein